MSSVDSLGASGFSLNQIEILWQFIEKQREVVQKLITADHSSYHFRYLEWELSTRIASRALLHQMTPLIRVKLFLDTETINENKEKLNSPEKSTQRQVVMQIDPGNLRSIIESLDEAILESKSHRTRLFVRAFQH